MAVHREEQEGAEDRQKLAERRRRGSRSWIDHLREAEPHRVADHLARHHRGGIAELDREAEREARDHLTRHQHETGDRGDAAVGQIEGHLLERGNADREADDQPHLHRHVLRAEDGRREEGRTRPDHRDHEEPELRFQSDEAGREHG